nr:hypothetical protein [Tanacetum cinerariifolium]
LGQLAPAASPRSTIRETHCLQSPESGLRPACRYAASGAAPLAPYRWRHQVPTSDARLAAVAAPGARPSRATEFQASHSSLY